MAVETGLFASGQRSQPTQSASGEALMTRSFAGNHPLVLSLW